MTSLFLVHIPIILWALPYFLAQATPGSYCTLSIQTLKLSIFPRSSLFFQWRLIISSQDMSAKCAHCYCRVLFPVPFSGQRWGTHTYTHLHLHVPLYRSECNKKNWVHTNTLNSNILFFHIFYYSDSEQFGFHYPQYICLFDQSILNNQFLLLPSLASPMLFYPIWVLNTSGRCPPQGRPYHSSWPLTPQDESLSSMSWWVE